jgi:hypothetical protein
MPRDAMTPPLRRATRAPGRRLASADADARERAALWSAYFHRFAGWPHGRHELAYGLAPVSCRRAFETLEGETGAGRIATTRRPVSHLLAAGWKPEPRHLDRIAAMAPRAPHERLGAHEAVTRLRRFGAVEHVGRNTLRGADRRPHDTDVPPEGRSRVVIEDGAATVQFETWLPRPLERVAHLIRPENWFQLGHFWRGTELRRRAETGRWDELLEHYVFDWNTLNTQEYFVHLSVDYGEQDEDGGGKTVRTDYAIMYEEDDEILIDDGFAQATGIPERPGWTHYLGEKKLKFASPVLNFLSIAIVTMLLENNADWLLRALPAQDGSA